MYCKTLKSKFDAFNGVSRSRRYLKLIAEGIHGDAASSNTGHDRPITRTVSQAETSVGSLDWKYLQGLDGLYQNGPRMLTSVPGPRSMEMMKDLGNCHVIIIRVHCHALELYYIISAKLYSCIFY
jgi:hypothetical protein